MVLLRVELQNNDEKIKFETHGILNKNKNTLIYDDNNTKTSIDFNNNILKRYDSDSCITFDFNNEVMSVDLISQKSSFTLEFKRIKLNKTDKLFEVEYVVDNTNKIYYKVEIINL